MRAIQADITSLNFIAHYVCIYITAVKFGIIYEKVGYRKSGFLDNHTIQRVCEGDVNYVMCSVPGADVWQ